MYFEKIKEELDNCARPLFFFHNDPDGLCSFLQFYEYLKEGYGVIVKSRPIIDMKFINKVRTHDPDKIFVLDIAMMEQEFVDEARKPIVWIDHHPIQDIHGVKYFNPKFQDDEHTSVAYLTYKVVEQNLWIAVVGAISDMHWPADLIPEFRKKYPRLLPKRCNDARNALYKSRVGKLSRIMSNVLKGTSSDAMKYVKALTRISEPDDLLNPKDARSRFIIKRHNEIEKEYQALLKQAMRTEPKGRIMLFRYEDNKIAFSSDLANEMIYNFPDKLIILGREKNGELKLSFRSNDTVLPPLINKAMVGCQGYGGGHDYASGACIKTEDFDRFIENFRNGIERVS